MTKAKKAMADEPATPAPPPLTVVVPPPPALVDFPEVETEVAVTVAEPVRVAFEQTDDLPDKPATDVQITLATGEVFRERLTSTPLAIGDALPDGLNISLSLAKVAAGGEVATDEQGRYMIVPPEARHELRLSGEDMATMGENGVRAALTHAREVAAAKARAYFAGMDIGKRILADRLG
jgi:hypothetical protein